MSKASGSELPQTELPPSYGESNSSTAAPAAANGDLPPATLYIAGRFIHSISAQAPPLYELSHSVGFLRDTDRSVSVERLDQTVKTAADGAPHVSTRKRHLFDIKHPTPAIAPPAFPYYGEAVSRQSMCSFGLTPFRPSKRLSLSSSAKGFHIHRVVVGEDRSVVSKEEMLTAVPCRGSAVGYEWSDTTGKLLAREVETDDLMTLVVGAEMTVGLRDVLVSAWITRVWWELSKGNYRAMNWNDAKWIMRNREDLGLLQSHRQVAPSVHGGTMTDE